MKKVWAVLSLLFVTMLCCSCGSSLKSMKDTDSFLIQDRMEKVTKGQDKVKVMNRNSPFAQSNTSHGVNVVASFILDGPVIGFATAGARNPFDDGRIRTKELSAMLDLGSHHTTYCKEGDSVWDLSVEALKRAGQPPKSDTCELTGAGVKDSLFEKVYEGNDGNIRLSLVVTPFVRVKGIPKVQPPCTIADLLPYSEYLDRITSSVKEIIAEENARLDKAGQERQETALKK